MLDVEDDLYDCTQPTFGISHYFTSMNQLYRCFNGFAALAFFVFQLGPAHHECTVFCFLASYPFLSISSTSIVFALHSY